VTSLASTTLPPIKTILMAASGGAKTSAIIPLAIPTIVKGWPGKKLLVLNFDGPGKFSELAKIQLDDRLARKGNGLTSITQDQYDAAIVNIDFEDCGDPKKIARDATGYHAHTISADAWTKAKKTLDKWWQTISTSPQDCIVVIDSFTHFAYAVANYTMAMASRLNKVAEGYKDYMPAQQEIRAGLNALVSIPCGLIITAHQEAYEIKKSSETPERDPETGEMVFREEIVDSIMLPRSFGQSGRTDIPSGVNHLLYLTTNKNQQREIRLTPGRGILPKSPYFARAKKSYDIDRGLVEYFMLGEQR
jgi:hypothetical protein